MRMFFVQFMYSPKTPKPRLLFSIYNGKEEGQEGRERLLR